MMKPNSYLKQCYFYYIMRMTTAKVKYKSTVIKQQKTNNRILVHPPSIIIYVSKPIHY